MDLIDPALFPHEGLLALVAGAVLLAFGRRLYWLLLGLIGFLVAAAVTTGPLDGEPTLTRLLIAVVAGLIGVMIAIFLQKLAVGLVGSFVGGAAMAMVLGVEAEKWYRVGAGQGLALLLAAIAGAVLAAWLFDLALIAGSSFVGAGLIVDALGIGDGGAGGGRLLLFALLVLVGIAVQTGVTARRAPREAPAG